MPVNWVIICPGIGLSAVCCQAITWNNAEIYLFFSIGNNFQWNLDSNFISTKCIGKCHLQNFSLFVQDLLHIKLTHLPLHKIAAIFAGSIFKCIFMTGKGCISIQISLKFVPKGPNDNKAN